MLLQIAGVMPPEVSVFRAINKSGDGVYPAGMRKTPEAFLHRLLHVRKQIPAAQGVTMEADRFRKLLQEATETAAVGWKRVAVPWHFAGIAQRSADGEGLFLREGACPRGFHSVTLPSGSLAPFVMPKYRPSS